MDSVSFQGFDTSDNPTELTGKDGHQDSAEGSIQLGILPFSSKPGTVDTNPNANTPKDESNQADDPIKSLMDKIGPMPPTPEADKTPAKKPRHLGKKALHVAVAGVFTFGAVEQINAVLTTSLYPQTAASTYEIPTHTPKAKEHSATFVLGGLGTVDSGAYATAERPALQHDGRIYAVVYPTDMNEKSIARAINTRIQEDDLTKISIDGVSSGGVVELNILHLLNTKANGGVKIKHLEFDDTPILPSDIRDQNYAIPVWLYHHGLSSGGGAEGKLIGQFYNHFNHPNDYFNIKHQLADTWIKTVDPIHPSLWIRQLALDASNTMPETVRDLASVRYRSILFVHPAILTNDRTVKDKPAVQQLLWANHEAAKIRHKAREENLPVYAIPVPIYIPPVEVVRLPGNVSHASALAYPKIYNLWLGQKLADSNK